MQNGFKIGNQRTWLMDGVVTVVPKMKGALESLRILHSTHGVQDTKLNDFAWNLLICGLRIGC